MPYGLAERLALRSGSGMRMIVLERLGALSARYRIVRARAASASAYEELLTPSRWAMV